LSNDLIDTLDVNEQFLLLDLVMQDTMYLNVVSFYDGQLFSSSLANVTNIQRMIEKLMKSKLSVDNLIDIIKEL
jgi:hypothetical protein